MKALLTLRVIRNHNPCGLDEGSDEGYDLLKNNLGEYYGDDTPITFKQVIDSNGIDDALWCLRCLPEEWDSKVRHLACDFAESVVHLAKDERCINAIHVSRRFADGNATDSELDAARDATRVAARAAAWATARVAARAAARDARAAAGAAWATARDAARDAARAAAWATARDARDAAWATARDARAAAGAARDAESKKQEQMLLKMVGEIN